MEDFDDLLEFFQRKKAPCNENDLGENIKLDRGTVMDNVSGLADRSENFKKIRSDVCLYFSYNLSDETELANDTCTDENL